MIKRYNIVTFLKENKMSKKKVLTEDKVFNILKKFTLDCVHGGDFDQGNTEEQTLSILKTWWNIEKNKYSR